MGIRIEKLLNQFPAVGKCKNLIGHPGHKQIKYKTLIKSARVNTFIGAEPIGISGRSVEGWDWDRVGGLR